MTLPTEGAYGRIELRHYTHAGISYAVSHRPDEVLAWRWVVEPKEYERDGMREHYHGNGSARTKADAHEQARAAIETQREMGR